MTAVLCDPISSYLTFVDISLCINSIHPCHMPSKTSSQSLSNGNTLQSQDRFYRGIEPSQST